MVMIRREVKTMPSEILIALITVSGSLLGSIVGALASSKLTNYRLEQLEKKVENLSDVTQRLALIEQRMDSYEKAKK